MPKPRKRRIRKVPPSKGKKPHLRNTKAPSPQKGRTVGQPTGKARKAAKRNGPKNPRARRSQKRHVTPSRKLAARDPVKLAGKRTRQLKRPKPVLKSGGKRLLPKLNLPRRKSRSKKSAPRKVLTKLLRQKPKRRGNRPDPVQGRSVKRTRRIGDRKFQAALKRLQDGKGIEAIAKEIRVSQQRLERQLRSTRAARKRKGRWLVRADLPRRLLLFTTLGALVVTLGDRSEASLAGQFMNAVRRFLSSNEKAELEPFQGKFATDIRGREWYFETEANVIHQLGHTEAESFETIYRIVV